jgi:hypothetical protein
MPTLGQGRLRDLFDSQKKAAQRAAGAASRRLGAIVMTIGGISNDQRRILGRVPALIVIAGFGSRGKQRLSRRPKFHR